MAYTLLYHPEVKAKDVPTLNRDVAKGFSARSKTVWQSSHKDTRSR
jgi:hypothetical protein